MLFFSKRRELERRYYEWIKENGVKDCPFSVISYITYREWDLDLLMEIRNGYYQNADGTYCEEFFEMVEDMKNRLEYAKKNTSLPDHPNMKQVEEFVMSVNRRALNV